MNRSAFWQALRVKFPTMEGEYYCLTMFRHSTAHR